MIGFHVEYHNSNNPLKLNNSSVGMIFSWAVSQFQQLNSIVGDCAAALPFVLLTVTH